MDEASKIERFRKLVRAHDVTYNYSDDGAVWRRGQAERDEILALADELPFDVAAQIWNERMDEVLVAHIAPTWYWKAKAA